MRFLMLALIAFLFSLCAQAQEKHRTYNTFAADRLLNGHSVETLEKGLLNFNIMHRFGGVGNGWEDFFGLDVASYRLELAYGFTDRFSAGIGRSGFQKTLDGYVKHRLLWQGDSISGPPISLTWVSVGAFRTQEPFDGSEQRPSRERFSYWHQALISRKWSSRWSTQLMPSLLHRNYVRLEEGDNTLPVMGVGAKFQITKVVGVTTSAYFSDPDAIGNFEYPMGLGFDIKSGGHVFQLLLTNTQGMIGPHFTGYTEDAFTPGNLRIGFNIRRVFRISGRNYH